MKVLVTGERGQLGNELRRCFDTMRAEIGPVPGVYKDAKVDYVDYQVLDISDADAVDAHAAGQHQTVVGVEFTELAAIQFHVQHDPLAHGLIHIPRMKERRD